MQRMSGIDPMFIYSETPETPMEVAYACVFDPATAPGGYSFDGVKALLAERVPTLPPFRRRLMAVPFGLDHPRWVDDPEFTLDNHLHRAAVPDPGGETELTRMVADIMGRPLRKDQPPWEMHVIEGLRGGRVGLVAKIHHSVIDGVAGAQLMAQLLDLSAEGRTITEFCPPWLPPALPSSAQLVADALPNLITSPIRTWRAVREIGRTAVRLARRAADSETGPISIPLGAPATFETPVGANRAVSFAELNMREVLELKEQFGVTVNDVVLAVSSGALRRHLAVHDPEASDPLVAIVPVSVRALPEGEAQGQGQGNRLSAMFVALANDVEKPLDRLRAISGASACTKAQERSVGYGPMASAVSDAVPPPVARAVLRLGAHMGVVRRLRAGNLMISNIPGPTFPLYFAGMRMEAVHPLGPIIDGVALNITVQSYRDSLFVGMNACATAVPDLPALARAMTKELGHLRRAANLSTPVKRKRRAATASGRPANGVHHPPHRLVSVPTGKAG
ncbi:MAG TPA: wax ester/triacylglycerol synthase family O-acyltransferase [Acidimicrobiales bacterium]|jgi:WS/DGAT/MGAT family acyltransferase|nr:wax ester/triacylglycerol synthase family O-acyltransferase [Acidimicrobiales bacterium]